jgi:hypothetical protein
MEFRTTVALGGKTRAARIAKTVDFLREGKKSR